MRPWLLALVVVVASCDGGTPDGAGVELGKVGTEPPDRDRPQAKVEAKDGDGDEDAKPPTKAAANPFESLASARRRSACNDAMTLVKASEFYREAEGKLPRNVADIATLKLASADVVDPWGSDYAISGPDLKVTSPGPDEELGTADDIIVQAGPPDPCAGI